MRELGKQHMGTKVLDDMESFVPNRHLHQDYVLTAALVKL